VLEHYGHLDAIADSWRRLPRRMLESDVLRLLLVYAVGGVYAGTVGCLGDATEGSFSARHGRHPARLRGFLAR
jgi:hypothetical protein